MNPNDYSKEALIRFKSLQLVPLETLVSPTKGPNGITSAKELWRRKSLLKIIVIRDLKGKYKDSFFGILWTLVRPMVQLLVFYLVIGKFLGAERGIPQFAIFIFAGLTAWGLFSEIVASTTGSIVSNSGIVKKIYLPREIFPLASVGVSLFNFLVQLLILVVATLILRPGISLENLLYFFPSTILILFFATALGLSLSAINVFLRDTQYLVDVALMVLIWASPIMYSWSMAKNIISNDLAVFIYTSNPITLAVMGYQKAFWESDISPTGTFPDNLWIFLWVSTFVSLILILISQRVFLKLQGNFAQVL